MISKPAVSGKSPIVITSSGYAANAAAEVVSVHYNNSTAGAGRVNVRDGGAAGEIRLVMGTDSNGGNDGFDPCQPAKFNNDVYIEFETGTGTVTILMN